MNISLTVQGRKLLLLFFKIAFRKRKEKCFVKDIELLSVILFEDS